MFLTSSTDITSLLPGSLQTFTKAVSLSSSAALAASRANRKQSEIISAQARTIEEVRGTIVELNASLAWLKRKVFGKMSEKCKPVDNGDPKLPFDYGDLEQIEAEIEDARSRAAEQITVPKSRAANKTPRRNRVVMDNLPVVTVVIEPENVDLSRYVKIGEEHTRTLEMKPGYLYVKDTVRPTYALKNEMEAVDNGEKAVHKLIYH